MTRPERADVTALREYSGQLQERLHRMMEEEIGRAHV